MRFPNPYVCIVTGGTSGIGEGCARLFAKEGASVVFCAPGINDGKRLEAELNAAAPEVFLQISAADACELGVTEGDIIEAASRRGKVQGPVRIGDILPGHVFIPFHFGCWDNQNAQRAANELTITGWDAVSKQPHFKYAAVKLTPVKKGSNEDTPVFAGAGVGERAATR